MVGVFGVLGIGLMWLGRHPVTTYPLGLWLVRSWRYCSVRLPVLFDLREKFALWWSTPRRTAWRSSCRITGRLAALGEIARRFWEIAAALAGTALGIWYPIRGVDFQVSTPPQSARQRADGA